MRGGSYLLVAIIVLMAISLAIASGYSYLQAKIAPMLVGGVILLLAVVELIKELRAGKMSDAAPSKVCPEEQIEGYLREAGWMVGFCALIYLVGFLIAIAAFSALYAKAHKAGWATSMTLGLCMSALSYALFSYLVGTDLYPGFVLLKLGLAG